MKKPFLISVFIAASAIQSSYAGDNILINTKQIQALGIITAPLPHKRSGEVSGLPAQIVIPGSQLFVISTPMPAMIEQTFVGIGDMVKKGQVIAQLQSPALAEAQRGLLQSSVQQQITKDNLLRDEALLKDGIIAESRYRLTKGSAMEAQAAFTERKNMLHISGMSDNAINQLISGNHPSSLLTLTSPIDGVVLEKSASAGQRLDAAVPVFKVAKITPLALEIQAPFTATRDLAIGATVTLPAYNASGKITAIGRSLTASNQTILLRAVITQGAERLLPGQFVEASITTGTNSTAQWEVPNSAISRLTGKAVVFVENTKGFRSLPITVLNEGAQNSVISGDFKGDERIAIRGVSSLKSGVMGIGGGDK